MSLGRPHALLLCRTQEAPRLDYNGYSRIRHHTYALHTGTPCSLCYLCLLSRASLIFAFSTRKRHRLEWMHLVAFELVQGVLSTIHGRLLIQVLLIPIIHRISSTRNASSPHINSPSIQQAQVHIPRNPTRRLESYHPLENQHSLLERGNDKGNVRDTVRERHEAKVDGLREGPDFPVGDKSRCGDR